MPILGLATTESDTNWRFKNIRRQVFYFYPNGAAPLTGLLSLINDEDTDDPEFQWWEKRLDGQLTVTVAANALGPFIGVTNPSSETDDTLVGDMATQAWTVGGLRRLKVGSVTSLRNGHMIMIRAAPVTGGGTFNLTGVITSINTSTKNINIRSTCAPTATVTNTATSNGLDVLVIGSGFTQGSAATTGGIAPAAGQYLGNSSVYNLPLNAQNFCQTFRTPFELTGTALKTGLKFDDTGPYRDQAKEASVYHMIEIEKAFLFGQPAKETVSTNSLPRFSTCGIIPAMEIWEAATADARITAGFPQYRGPIGTQTAVTLDTDDNKRIIVNSGGVINEKLYNGYLERVFRITNNTANEKLVLCGSGALSVLNQMYKDKSTLTTDIPMTDSYGMNITKHVCPFGTLYYKSHPLFSQNAFLRNCLLILDVQNLKYRYVQGRDTQLLKNRQNNGDDFRRDEWLSECGLEFRFPESNMFLQNIQSYTP